MALLGLYIAHFAQSAPDSDPQEDEQGIYPDLLSLPLVPVDPLGI